MKFRTAMLVVLNSAVAIFGVFILERLVNAFYHPPTLTETRLYLQEYSLGAVFAFLLGALVYLRWKNRSGLWTWLVGVLLFGVTCALESLQSGITLTSLAIFGMVSILPIFYSIGAYASRQILRPGAVQKSE